ncbi:hypothetical protein [Actinoplanes sp. L3-i22]|uniref:hypothetical protein n=1 Tax=Actinoplanes sp. L3-i22 TaxID=2836373 RepID=UPI001C767F78|nr:hypothetical protein [Actinoplanes sp. L3-i22]BCY11859.1 hypothetical protein L3i22_069470 [Actinoplanes sp. L3-i22]
MKSWDWALAAIVLVFCAPIVAGAVVLYHGWDPAKAYFVGQPGKVAPFADCRWVERTSSDKDPGWECRGVFTGGGLRVNNVRITPRPWDRPTGPVPATVSGPSATQAYTDTSAVQLLGSAIAGLFMMTVPGGVGIYRGRKDIATEYRERRRRWNKWRKRRDLRRELEDIRAEVRDIRRDLDRP